MGTRFNKVALSFNAHLRKVYAGMKYAEVYWQHLGGGFQKDPQVQEDLSEFLIKIK
jgi:hypothetical protein